MRSSRCDACNLGHRGRRRWRSVQIPDGWQAQLLLCPRCLTLPLEMLGWRAIVTVGQLKGRSLTLKPAV